MSAAAFASSAITKGAPARQPRAQLSLRSRRRSDAGVAGAASRKRLASAAPELDLLASRSKRTLCLPLLAELLVAEGATPPKFGLGRAISE